MKYLLLVVLLCGCAGASLVQRTYLPEKGGVVKYKNSLFGNGREEALTTMVDYCKSEYQIIQENNVLENKGYTMSGNYAVPVNSQRFYITFKCVN